MTDAEVVRGDDQALRVARMQMIPTVMYDDEPMRRHVLERMDSLLLQTARDETGDAEIELGPLLRSEEFARSVWYVDDETGEPCVWHEPCERAESDAVMLRVEAAIIRRNV